MKKIYLLAMTALLGTAASAQINAPANARKHVLTRENVSNLVPNRQEARSNDGSFGSIGSYCGWWSSSESNIANYVFGRYLYYSSGDCVKGYTNKIDGLTVRFVKD